MAGPDSVDSHVPHDPQLPPGGLFMEGSPQRSQIMVHAYALELHMLSVQKEALIRIKPRGAESDPAAFLLLAVAIDQGIQRRMLHRLAVTT